MQQTFGSLTPQAINLAIKDMLGRAAAEIRTRRLSFVSHAKKSYNEKPEDLYTDADVASQKVFHKLILESFPHFGIIGEEAGLRKKAARGMPTITIDPLDGTRAFARLQPEVSVMLGIQLGGKAVAGYVLNPFTGDLFYTRLGSKKVHWITQAGQHIELAARVGQGKLSGSYVLLRNPLELCSVFMQKFAQPSKGGHNNLFRSYSIARGSIGITFARLWTGESPVLHLPAGTETPWDLTPLLAISQKLNFVFLAVKQVSRKAVLRPVHIAPPTTLTKRPYELLVVHKNHLAELMRVAKQVPT